MLFQIQLAGPAGEPVDLWRTLVSHGVADLPPMRVDEKERTLTATFALPAMKPRTVVLRPAGRSARVDVLGPKPSARTEQALRSVLHRVLNLDEDLSGFYEAAAADPELAWATTGAGRMLRSPTVFEEVVNTTCSCTHRSHDTGPREGRSALGEPGFERGGPNRTAFKQ